VANLTQTAQGDLTSFIAGKIFERVKESLDDREIPKGSPEVEKAAKELEVKQEVDTDSVPVVDQKLRNQVNKLFGTRLEVKLVQLEGRVEKTNAAIKTIGAGITDTQELIVNQNQILEDKFDKILDAIGTAKEIKDKNVAKLKADKESADITDQNKMFDSEALAESLSNNYSSGTGLLGFLLRRTLGRAGTKLLTKASRKFIPRRIRARGRLAGTAFDTVKRTFSTGRALTGARGVAARILGRQRVGLKVGQRLAQKLTPNLGKIGTKKLIAKGGAKVASKKIPVLGAVAGGIFAIERALKGDYEGAGLEILSGLSGALPGVGTATSFGVDAYIIRRDVERELRKEHTGSYAAGTGRTKKGAATLHGTEMILGKKDINDISLGFKNAIGLIGTVLTSVSLDVASAAGAESLVRSQMIEDGLGNFDRAPAYVSSIGRVNTANLDVKAIDKVSEFRLPTFSKPENKTEETEEKGKKKFNLFNPFTWFNRGGSGSNVNLDNESLIDASKEPGVDFTPDGPDNRALFDGQVVQIGYQYDAKRQRGYGNFVVVRSIDPNNGMMFDSLYAHIPKNAIYVKKNDMIKVGDKLGRMGTDNDDPTDIGSINGTHMSVDFFKPDSYVAYPYWRTHIVPLVDTKFRKPKLKKKTNNPNLKATSMEMLGKYEGVKLNAYQDSIGIWTIGYGATRIRDKVTGNMRNVRPGDSLTKQEALALKDKDYQRHYDIAERELNAQGLSLTDLPVNVAAPLISAVFNYGSLSGVHDGSKSKWMIRGKEVTFPNSLPVMIKNAYKSGDYSKISDLLRFNLSQDQDGLNENRRKSEASIIESGTDSNKFYNLHDLNLLGDQSFLPSKNRSLLTAKMDSDSKDIEALFDKVESAGQPIILLNTQIIANASKTPVISRSNKTIDWKDQYRIASLG
tara:strand:- start:1012 stop:3747 length:2736 start_codon:yes stop_codon:yes gene_type:complete